ncbi:MAG: glycogen/starch synthase [Rhodothermia bacterium]|nr:glycogen/starch synthase [Rhodothermia bacterium]
MKILHISAECYPVAKAGGLGDVVGALPKYLCVSGQESAVILPKYALRWIKEHRFVEDFRGTIRLHDRYLPFTIEREIDDSLGFPLYVANIPALFERDGIYASPDGYGYGDDVSRWLGFQQAVLQWVSQFWEKPKILHCHDHHTGLIPFMVKHCPEFHALHDIPTIFTIHNGAYTGAFSWQQVDKMPFFESSAKNLLDWADTIHPLASAIRCAWRVNTVSPGYMDELKSPESHLEWLLNNEWQKSSGIINGIDAQVWNPATDPLIAHRFEGDVNTFKAANKAAICQRFRLDPELPIITFIGRLVNEKGADLLPGVIQRALENNAQMAFLILGTGDPNLKRAFYALRDRFYWRFDASIEYNESLAHQLYAGSDFLIMPSRIEPCGLNQLYAFRYGTIPIVRSVGGLRDTVRDWSEENPRGIRFDHFSEEDALHALYRASLLYSDKNLLTGFRKRIMDLNFSWEKSAEAYISLYKSVSSPL